MSRKSFLLITCLIALVHFCFLWYKLSPRLNPENVSRPLSINLTRDTHSKKQIVQSLDSDRREVKDNAFLSDKTRSFDRERVARKTDIFTAPSKKKGEPSGEKKISMRDLGAMVKTDPFVQAAKNYTDQKNGNGGEDSATKVSATNDYIEDIPLGDLTSLNSIEYKYYGFYHRMKQKLEQFWGRSIHEKAQELANTGRRVPTSEEHITALVVVLNEKGSVIDIYLKGSSGIKELDEAAIEAFNEAGPFPNPPKGMLKNGRVIIEWGFVVSS